MITEIQDFTFREFVGQDPSLISQYMQILEYLEPIPTKRELFHRSFGTVDFIRQNLGTNNLWELVEIMVMMGEKDPLSLPITVFYPKLWSIKKQLKKIIEAEESLMPTYSDPKAEAVNYGERMKKFGVYNTIDNLAGGNFLDWEKVSRMPYSEVFTKLLMEKERADLQHEMSKIKTTK